MSQDHFLKKTIAPRRFLLQLAGINLIMMFSACSPNDLDDLVNAKVRGNVTGLKDGNSFTMQNNNGDDVVITANGPFEFSQALGITNRYQVTVLVQPGDQTCSVFNASGVISVSEINDVIVECEDN